MHLWNRLPSPLNTTSVIGLPFEITVLDEQGNPVAGVAVSVDGVAQEGVTDAQGKMTLKFDTAGKVVLSATTTDTEGAVHYAWSKDVTVHTVLGDGTANPFYVQNNFIANGVKSFTWLSSITGAADKAVVRVYTEDPAVNADAAYREYTGATALVNYATESARINTVRVEGLSGAYYYTVGDGTTFGEVMHAAANCGAADVYILGDVQTTNVTNAQTIMNMINNDGTAYDFSIQTGDFVDGTITTQMWDLPQGTSGSYYSVERDGVYVAVINYSLTGTYEDAFNWLIQDARASSARWKIVTMHVPTYCTNPEAHNQFVHEQLPIVAQKAGIDFAFAGHDHAFARTEPVRDGQVSEKDGIVYYICGAVGDKEYNITPNPEYHFAVTNGDYKAMYLTVHADGNSLTVKAVNLNGEVIDTYTKQYVPCADGVHSYEVNPADGMVACRECGVKPTGIVEGVDGKRYYAMDGEVYSGWRSAFEGTDMYYFDPVTYAAATGKTTIDHKEFTFNEQGVLIRGAFVQENGGTRYYFGEHPVQLRWLELEEGTYWVDGNGYVAYGYYAHQEYNHAPYYWYHFDEQTGLLIGKCSGFVECAGQTYYCDETGKVAYGAVAVEDGILFSGTKGLVVKNQSCYIDADTVGSTNLEQGVYYCNEQGRIVSDGFVEIDGKTYYFTNYVRTKGFTKLGEDYYLFNAGNGLMYRDANMWVNKNEYGIEPGMHYFAAYGKMFIPDPVNGEKQIIEENGNLYFTIDGIKMTNGLLADANGYYGFDADGKLIKTGFVDNGKNVYYYDNAARAKGFTKIGEEYYLFNAGSGAMCRNARMWVNSNEYGIASGYHEFGADGKMIK